MKFYESGSTHGDFIVITRDSPNVRDALLRMGARRLQIRAGALFYWGFPDLDYGDIALSGVGRAGSKIVAGPTAIREWPHAVGQWLGVRVGSEKLEVQGDFLGSLPVFHGRGAVSNRLHLFFYYLSLIDSYDINFSAIESFFIQNQAF